MFKKIMDNVSFIVGTILFLIDVLFLYQRLFSANEFITFFALIITTVFLVHLRDKLDEIVIAGNTIKLRKVTEEAEKLIIDLKKLGILNAKFMIESSGRSDGGYGSGRPFDDRLEKFIPAYKEVEKLDFSKDLKEVIHKVSIKLLESQLKNVNKFCKLDSSWDIRFPASPEVFKEAISKKLSEENSETINCTDCYLAIDAYEKIYDIYKRSA
ncbi:hypothetical protein [Zymobacter sp. IVIA_12111.31 C1]|uniref:hypothetical protein n=1 Tax=Zymobacter sp. IVIA_12111.31 C1 TaxID=3394854 RepID=UPI0039C08217